MGRRAGAAGAGEAGGGRGGKPFRKPPGCLNAERDVDGGYSCLIITTGRHPLCTLSTLLFVASFIPLSSPRPPGLGLTKFSNGDGHEPQ